MMMSCSANRDHMRVAALKILDG
uniref:Uncharacterized protein n=1 Tax=Rhizophora mucronata TaxID=61149 RepID=A0A2P2P7E4_RHIMU